jgi:hypothetical protein
MRYNLYAKVGLVTTFLQTSDSIETLQVPKGTYTRWMTEMGFNLSRFPDPTLIIEDCGVPAFQAPYNQGRRKWVKIKQENA